MELNLPISDTTSNNSLNSAEMQHDLTSNNFDSVLDNQMQPYKHVENNSKNEKIADKRQNSTDIENNHQEKSSIKTKSTETSSKPDEHRDFTKEKSIVSSYAQLDTQIHIDITFDDMSNVSVTSTPEMLAMQEVETDDLPKVTNELVELSELDNSELIDTSSQTQRSDTELASNLENQPLFFTENENQLQAVNQLHEDIDINNENISDVNSELEIDFDFINLLPKKDINLTNIDNFTNVSNQLQINTNNQIGDQIIANQSAELNNTNIDIHLNSPNWNVAFRSQIQWLVHHNEKGANIQINPPELGPLQVKITIKESEANITFNTNAPEAKEAIAMNIPKLREMLDTQGINLNHTEVNDFSSQQQGEQETQQEDILFVAENESTKESTGSIQIIDSSMVNVYA